MDRSQPTQSRKRESTILIADDDSAILSLVSEVLRQHEFIVVTAKDGAQALACARDHAGQIDLLLTDFDMPHLNGVELTAKIRQFLPHIRVILMSGSPKEEAAAKCGSKFLEKPFTPPMLVETITRLLEGKGSR